MFNSVILYQFGPGTVNIFFGRQATQNLEGGALCLETKLNKFSNLINKQNGHKSYIKEAEDGLDRQTEGWIHYVGNGNIGLR